MNVFSYYLYVIWHKVCRKGQSINKCGSDALNPPSELSSVLVSECRNNILKKARHNNNKENFHGEKKWTLRITNHKLWFSGLDWVSLCPLCRERVAKVSVLPFFLRPGCQEALIHTFHSDYGIPERRGEPPSLAYITYGCAPCPQFWVWSSIAASCQQVTRPDGGSL